MKKKGIFLVAIMVSLVVIPLFSMTNVEFPVLENPTESHPPQLVVSELQGPTDWWNDNWRYRIQINVTETGIALRVNEPVDVYLTINGTTGNASVESFRVLDYEEGTKTWTEIPSQVWNVTYFPASSNVSSATITFQVDSLSKYATHSYYIYYNETAIAPSYSTGLSYTHIPYSPTQQNTLDDFAVTADGYENASINILSGFNVTQVNITITDVGGSNTAASINLNVSVYYGTGGTPNQTSIEVVGIDNFTSFNGNFEIYPSTTHLYIEFGANTSTTIDATIDLQKVRENLIKNVTVTTSNFEVSFANESAVEKFIYNSYNYHTLDSMAPASDDPSQFTQYNPHANGYIWDWLLLGPFENTGSPNCLAAVTDYLLPEATESTVRPAAGESMGSGGYYGPFLWFEHHSGGNLINFNNIFSPNDYVASYAFAYIYSFSTQTVQLRLGSDDGIWVWLNGDNIWSNHRHRGASPDQDIVTITLEKGYNTLLIKVEEVGGGWGFYARMTDTLGVPLDSSDFIVILERPTTSNIDSITLVESGPVFLLYQVNWTQSADMTVEDTFTFYSDFPMWRILRKISWDEHHDQTNNSFVLLDSAYDIASFDEYFFDGSAYSPLSGSYKAANYTFVHDSIGDDLYMTLGMFLTTIQNSSDLDLLGQGMSMQNWTTDYSDPVVHLRAGSETDLIYPGAGAGDFHVDLTFYEYGKQLITDPSAIESEYQKLLSPVQVNVGTTNVVSFNLKVVVTDVDNIYVENSIITVNRTDDVITPITQNTDSTGSTTFSNLKRGTYTINVTYVDFGKTLLLGFQTTELNVSKTITFSTVHLSSIDFTLSSDLASGGTFLENANITIFNASTSELIGSIFTDGEGAATFVWQNTTGNYSLVVNAFGGERPIRYQPTRISPPSPNSIDVISGTTVSGTISSIVTENNQYYVINSTDSTPYLIDANFTWIGIQNQISGKNLERINITFVLNLSTTIDSAKAWIYNWTGNVWEFMTDVNVTSSRVNHFISQDTLTLIDISNQLCIKINGSDTTESYNLSIDMIDILLTYGYSEYSNILNFTLASYAEKGIEVKIGTFSTTLINYTNTFQSKIYGESFDIKIYYNYSYDQTEAGIGGANVYFDLSKEGTPIPTSGIDFTEVPGEPGNYTLDFNATHYNETLGLTTGAYLMSVHAEKASYTPTSAYFILVLQDIPTDYDTELITQEANIYWTQNVTIRLNYTTVNPSSIAGATATYRWGVLTGDFVENSTHHFYDAIINTSWQMPGYQTIIIDVEKQNYEEQEDIIVTFIVNEKPTRLNESHITFYPVETFALEAVNFSFRYTDNITGAVIHNAMATYTWYNVSNPSEGGSDTLDEVGDFYILDFNTENRLVGSYIIGISIKQVNYSQPSMTLQLTVNPRPATLDVDNILIEIERSNDLSITLNLTDDRLGIPLDNFTIQYRIYEGASLRVSGDINASVTGIYPLTLQMSSFDVGTYRVVFTVIHDNYSVSSEDITIDVTWIKIFGLLPEPMFYLLLICIIAFVVAISAYVFVKRARIPFVIKKIDETVKIVEKGKKEASIPVTKLKEELYSKIFKDSFNTIGIAPPTIVKLEGLAAFIDLLATAKVRLSPSEAEKLIASLNTLPKDDALTTLRNMGIPPDMCDRLLTLAKASQSHN